MTRGGRRWIWVFGEIEGLRWVLRNGQMAFSARAATRASQIRRGDRAIIYVARGAFHNPTRDEARLGGILEVAANCRQVDPIMIAGREFRWACRIRPSMLLPERQGPTVRSLAEDLDRVKRPEVWGQYFRTTPIEASVKDFELLERAVQAAASSG